MRVPFIISWLISVCLGILSGIVSGNIWLGIFTGIFCQLSLTFYGAYSIRSGFFLKTVNKIPGPEKSLVLSFDDGPDPLTPQVLDVLEKHKIKALFFLIGHKIKANEGIVKRLQDEGHLVGNHTYSHTGKFYFWNNHKMQQDIDKTTGLIEGIIHQKVRYFRPPFGVTNPSLARAVKKTGLKTIGWKFRSFDTVRPLDGKMENRLMNELNGGDILLFHDTSPGMAEFLDRMIPKLKEKGFKFVLL